MEKEPISLNDNNYPNILYTMGKSSRCKNGSRKCLGKCYKTIRKTRGEDIDAACGQLANKNEAAK